MDNDDLANKIVERMDMDDLIGYAITCKEKELENDSDYRADMLEEFDE